MRKLNKTATTVSPMAASKINKSVYSTAPASCSSKSATMTISAAAEEGRQM